MASFQQVCKSLFDDDAILEVTKVVESCAPMRADLHIQEVGLLALVCYATRSGVVDSSLEDEFKLLLLSVGDAVNARSIIRGFFITQFELDVEFPNVPHERDVSMAQAFDSVRSVFWHTMSVGMRCVRGAKETMEQWLWAMARKAFEVCLGSYYDVLMKSAAWITDIWDRMQRWCADILTQTADWMAGFKDCLVLGIGMIGVAAVLVLIEKFLIASGLLAGPLGLAQTFIMCYLAYVGIREGKAILKENAITMVAHLIDACKNVVSAVASSMNADGSVGTNAQFSPISCLEVFASSLSGFSGETVIGVGRVFNSFSQIRSGATAIWTCVEKIFEFLWVLLDKGFGIQSRALADLSTMLGKDVQGWLKRCDAACEHMCLFPSIPQDILKTFKVLKAQGQDIRAALLARSERGSVVALASVSKALDKLSQLLSSAILAGSSGPRYEPLWVAFTGSPGVGKSTAVNLMVARYLRDNSLSADDYYSRNATDPFWSGYRRQAVVTYDDLGALSNATGLCEEGELIKLVSRDALPLNMASLEEKGMYFDSSLIVTSSNFMNYSPHAQIHDSQAYQRRRSLLVEIVAKEGVERDSVNPVAHQQYVLRRSLEPFDVLMTFDSFEDFYAYFLDCAVKHSEVQRDIMRAMEMPEKTLCSTVCAMSQLAVLLMPVVPISLQTFIKDYHQGYQMLACFDGKLYLWNEKFDLRIVENYIDEVDPDDERRANADALTVAMRFKDVMRGMPNLDPLAACFLVDLVEKQAFDAQLNVTRGLRLQDDQLFEVANNMPRWQRALTYVLASSLRSGKQGIFGKIYEGMCTTLQKAYVFEVASWPMAVKLGFGVVALLVFGGTVFKALQYLGNFGCGAAFAVAATQTFSVGQSDDEVRRKTSEYRHRNNPIQKRHWSYGQNFGTGYEWLMKHCLASLRYAHLDCQVLVLPGKRLVGVHHFLRRIPNGVIVQISLDEQAYHVCWHRESLMELEGSELSLYSHATLRDVSSTVDERIVFGLEHLPDTFAATMASCKFDELTQEYVSEVASITVLKRKKPLTIYAGEYQRVVPTCLEYKANTVNRDCGSLIIANIGGIDKLVGIHVAGLAGYGQACFLPQQLERTQGQNWFEDHFEEFPFEEQVGNGTSVVGLLKQERKFFTQQKTAYVKTPEEWHLDTPCDKEPAILAQGDVRLLGTENAAYDPYRAGMAKYQQEAGPFEVDMLQEVCAEMCEEWFDAKESFDFAPTSIEVAINGIPGVEYMDSLVLNTSEGYPYLLSRDHNKGKSRFLVEAEGMLVPNGELQAGIERIEREAAVEPPVLVGVECAKDEKLPLKKVYVKPKTRLFTVLPMDYNIVVRRYFFPAVRFFMCQRHRLPCQVGVNPYGREWGRIATGLQDKGNAILCCDYSRFDGLLPKQVMVAIAEMLNKLMGGSDVVKSKRQNLLLACCGRYGICAGKVWRVENGIPSGFPLTVILNSIFNEIIVRYLYKRAFWKDGLTRRLFNRYVSLVTYGDDNLISVSETIHSKFNGKFVQASALELGITITDGVDKEKPNLEFRPLETCDFLKRRFVRDMRGLWRAPMELASLWSQLHWVKVKHLEKCEAFLVNLESVIRELVIHDVAMARDIRSRALRVEWIEPFHLPTIEQLVEWHEVQLYGKTEFSCYAYDALLTPAVLGPIGQVPKAGSTFEFKRMVATVSGAYTAESDDFVVCLQVASKYGANGTSVMWPTTSGRGELPVAHWLRHNVLRKSCELWKLLRHKYFVEEKRLVFLGRNSNVAATVFLVLVSLSFRVITVEESNTVLARAMEVTTSLGYLVDAFPEAFFDKSKKCISGALDYWPVYGATEVEVALLRKFAGRRIFERRDDELPVFDGRNARVDYCQRFSSKGVIVETYMRIPELGGLPGFNWQSWFGQPRQFEVSCSFGARVTVFTPDRGAVFDACVDGRLRPGGKLSECLVIAGQAWPSVCEQQHPLRTVTEKVVDFIEGRSEPQFSDRICVGTSTRLGNAELERLLQGFDIEYDASLYVPGVFSLDVLRCCVEQAAMVGHGGVLVEDFELSCQACPERSFGQVSDFVELSAMISKMKDRRARITWHCCYCLPGGNVRVFSCSRTGIVVRGRGDFAEGWERVFQPDGSRKTFAEMLSFERDKYSPRVGALRDLQSFLFSQH